MTESEPSTPPQPHYLGHRDRLRQKLLTLGGDAFSDYELMELLLMQAIPRRDVKPLAKELVAKFSSFAGAVCADKAELETISGVKDSTIAMFAIVREAALRLGKNDLTERSILNNWDAVIKFCKMKLAHKKIEVFAVLFLDTKKKAIAFEVLQEGTVDQTMVYPRELVKRCLELGATSVVVVHNHPTGDLSPSRADVSLTKTLDEALKVLSIELIDHLIISKRGHFSFKTMKYL